MAPYSKMSYFLVLVWSTKKYLLCEEVESPVVNIWSSVMLSELQSCRTWVISLTSFTCCVSWYLLFWQLFIFYIVCIPLEGVLKHRCKLLPGKKKKKTQKNQNRTDNFAPTKQSMINWCVWQIYKKKPHTYSTYNTAVNTTSILWPVKGKWTSSCVALFYSEQSKCFTQLASFTHSQKYFFFLCMLSLWHSHVFIHPMDASESNLEIWQAESSRRGSNQQHAILLPLVQRISLSSVTCKHAAKPSKLLRQP